MKDRLPQNLDRVEIGFSNAFGHVRRVSESAQYRFFVRLDDGFGGWFGAEELRVAAVGPASDPNNYR